MKAPVQAVVLAGGLATRMRPHTLTVPKSMLPVAGRPFVDWQLDRLAASGFDDVVFCIAHLGEQIQAHLRDHPGLHPGVRVSWSDEGAKLLGTAGALRAALPLLAPAFLVTYGDSYLPFDYAAPLRILAEHSDCDGVMAVYKNEGRWDASNVVVDAARAGGPWVLRYEKGAREPEFDHIDYGAIALRREVVAALAPGEAWGLDAVGRDLTRQRRLRACVAHERFFEIGSPQGLADLERHLHTRASPS